MSLPDVRSALARHFGADARALAAFRVSVALLVLADLAFRARYLVAFYTDAGAFPRHVLVEQYPERASVSAFALVGEPWAVALLFVATAVFAVLMLVGYRTTLATLGTAVLVVGLHYRNPLALNGGDTLLRALFLWAVFLPLGERWSVDALRESGYRRRVASAATAGVLLQVVAVYTVNAALKLRGDAWLSGDAIRYVFSLDMFVVLLGDTLANYPSVLEVFAHLWLAMLLCATGLVVLTGWLRAGLVGLFAAMHLGMAATMQLGLFPLISIAALLPFFPPAFWDRLPGRTAVPGVRELDLDSLQARIRDALPLVSVPEIPQVLVDWKRYAVAIAVPLLVAGMLVWNAASVGWVDVPEAAVDGESPSPRWNMFAPNPLGVDTWFVMAGTLESGERVDAFRGGPPNWDKPPDVSATYPSARWRKFLTNMMSHDDDSIYREFGGYLCDRWNRTHDSSLANVSIVAMRQPTRLDGPEPVERAWLANHTCAP